MKNSLLALFFSFPSIAFAQTFTSSQDIGAVGGTGSSSYSNSVYTITGSGAEIYDTSDEFRYTYASLTGDGEVTARLDSLNAVDSWTKAGVMIRETLAANSRYAYMLVSGSAGIDFEWRTSTGGWAESGGPDFVTRAPYWVRLRRTGNVFAAYVSPDGTNWRQSGGNVTISMAGSVYVGLAVTSHWDGNFATAKFSNVKLTGGSAAPPPTTPPPSTPPPSTPPPSTPPPTSTTLTSSADIGAVGAAGSSSSTNGVYTVRGSGWDIWDTRDEFRYVYTSLNGDGDVVARIDSLAAADSWTKAGVMIRETLNPSSRYAMTMVTGSNGADFQYRQTTGDYAAPEEKYDRVTRVPYWVRLRRAGNVFTGYISANGTTWTQRGNSVTIQMAATTFVGLAVTSGVDGALATATFSSVQVTGGATTPPPSTPPPATTGSAKLTWTAPTQNTDGSTLSNLSAFKVYWGRSPGVYSNQVAINNPLTTTWTLNNLAAGRWYFAVAAVTTSGVESVKSNEANKVIQ